MLTGRKALAKISGKPGKTQLINHFNINDTWYLVDLPGYGYAKVGKEKRSAWIKFVIQYIKTRDNLMCLFILIDTRIPPQDIDMDFIDLMGEMQVPINLVFTKTDKMSPNQINQSVLKFKTELLKTWEEMPSFFITSAKSGAGKEEILTFIEQTNETY